MQPLTLARKKIEHPHGLELEGDGGTYSMNVQVTPNQPPTAVTLYTINAGITDDSVELGWFMCEEDDFSKYEIYRSTSSGTLGTLVETIADIMDYEGDYYGYTDTGLSSGTTYYYTIRTYDTSGEYSDSSQVNATTSEIGDDANQSFEMSQPSNPEYSTLMIIVLNRSGVVNELSIHLTHIASDSTHVKSGDRITITAVGSTDISGYEVIVSFSGYSGTVT